MCETSFDLEDLINGEIRQQLGQKLYSAQRVAQLLGISKSALSKRLSSNKYSDIEPIRISNILLLTQEQFHKILQK